MGSFVQDMKRYPTDFHHNRPWNDGNAVPMHRWLCSDRSDVDKQRMTALGNVVVPACAHMAAQMLCRIVDSEPYSNKVFVGPAKPMA